MKVSETAIKYIHLIRHGITEANQKKMFYGHSDVPLAGEGIDEIVALKGEGVYPNPNGAEYFTSGLIRAEQTLSLIYGDVPHTRLDDFKEINFGDYEFKTHEELKNDPAYTSWVNDESGLSAPHGGESFAQFAKRVNAGFRRILDSGAEQLIVVCHGGVICVIMDSCFSGRYTNSFYWLPEPGHGYTVSFGSCHPEGYTAF